MNDPLKSIEYYQNLYSCQSEPWDYSRRGIEILRHQSIAKLLSEIKSHYFRTLDIGCSGGQLTKKLIPLSRHTIAMDVSLGAVESAAKRCQNASAEFLVAGLMNLPFQRGVFDLIVAADAIHEFVEENRRPQALAEIYEALTPNGHVLFTDYLRPQKAPKFIALIKKSRFHILKIEPLYDRAWYQFESWFKGVRHWHWVKKIIASPSLASCLKGPARLYGGLGSMHYLIVAQKNSL